MQDKADTPLDEYNVQDSQVKNQHTSCNANVRSNYFLCFCICLFCLNVFLLILQKVDVRAKGSGKMKEKEVNGLKHDSVKDSVS